MRRTPLTFAFAIAIAAMPMSALAGVVAPLPSPFESNQGSLLFDVPDGKDRDIAVLFAGQIDTLIGRKAKDTDPSWSPDGTRFVFVSTRDGSRDLWVADADGSGAQRLTIHRGDEYQPVWADHDRIVFVSNRDGDADLFEVAPSAGVVLRITSNDANDVQPARAQRAWETSPADVLFSSDRSGNADIMRLTAGDPAEVYETTDPADEIVPALYPGVTDQVAFRRGGSVWSDVLGDVSDPQLLGAGFAGTPAWDVVGATVAVQGMGAAGSLRSGTLWDALIPLPIAGSEGARNPDWGLTGAEAYAKQAALGALEAAEAIRDDDGGADYAGVTGWQLDAWQPALKYTTIDSTAPLSVSWDISGIAGSEDHVSVAVWTGEACIYVNREIGQADERWIDRFAMQAACAGGDALAGIPGETW